MNIIRKAKLENVNEMIQWMLQAISAHRELSKKTEMDLRLISDEILSNITFYAYEGTEGNMELSVEFDNHTQDIILCFMDSGIEFNPLESEDPNVNADIMEREIGGLGIYFTKEISKAVSWVREDGINKLTVIKGYES